LRKLTNIKLNSITIAATIVSLCIQFTGCSSSESQVKKNSILKNKLYLKDLTTGITFNSSNLKGKHSINKKQEVLIPGFSYFGKDTSLTLSINNSNIIYGYSVIVENNNESLKNAIESKLTETEGREIKFDCSTDSYDTTMGEFKREVCTISSGSQKFIYKEIWPRNLMNSPLHITKVILIDTALAKNAEDEESNSNSEKYKLDRNKAKKDI